MIGCCCFLSWALQQDIHGGVKKESRSSQICSFVSDIASREANKQNRQSVIRRRQQEQYVGKDAIQPFYRLDILEGSLWALGFERPYVVYIMFS